MPIIFLMRHGQDTDNAKRILNGRRNTELTDLGREQAAEAAEKLAGQEISKIYVSPLLRCVQTAEIAADKLGLPEAEPLPDLIERDFGLFTGRSADDIRSLTDDYLATDQVDYFLSGEGVEQFPQAYARAQKVLGLIERRHLNENVLLVTHGDFGKMLRAAYYGWTWEEGLMTPYFANTEVLELKR